MAAMNSCSTPGFYPLLTYMLWLGEKKVVMMTAGSNGCYALMSETEEQTENACAKLQERFAGAWKTRAGDLVLDVAFVRMDTDLQACPADRLLNTMALVYVKKLRPKLFKG